MTGAIIRGEDNFFTNIYEGNGGGQKVGKFVPFTDQATLTKSVKIDAGSDEGFYRDFTTPTNNKKWTFSGWFKLANLGTNRTLISSGVDGSDYSDVRFNTNNIIYFQNRVGATNLVLSSTDRSFEDTSKWYHIVLIYDSDQGSASDRWKVYVDGDLQSVNNYPGSGDASSFNKASVRHRLSVSGTTTTSEFTPAFEGDFAGIAQQMFFDGQAYTPDNFGITDTSTGRWIPKTLGSLTYGNNGFRLDFANTAGQTIGDDTSGNTNDFSLYNLTTADLTTDSPTQNHATLSPNRIVGSPTFSEGNLKITGTSTAYHKAASEKEFPSDISTGLYWEYTNSANGFEGGVIKATQGKPTNDSGENNGMIIQRRGGGGGNTYWVQKDNSETFYYDTGVSASDGQTIGVAVKSGKIWFAINNTWIGSGDPAAGTNAAAELDVANYIAVLSVYGSSTTMTVNFGQKSFQYTPPTGFVAYQQNNLPETDKGISDFVWIKNRDASDGHQLYDSSRGPLKELHSDSNAVESTTSDGLQKFLKGGCQIEDDVSVNTSGESYVAWNWVANGGTTAANTDGSGASIASTTQANQTAGFSIVQWTGSGSNGTVAHGLSQAPDWILIKNLTASGQSWHVYLNIPAMGNNRVLFLDTNATYSSSSQFMNNTNPTNKVFTVGTSGGVNQSTKSMLAYCWHEVEGYSKFGAYIGNSNADGPFIHCGFKPSWVMIKKYSGTGEWFILDRGRNPINTGTKEYLDADTTDSGGSLDAGAIDFLSNGFKIRQVSSQINNGTHAFMAFAEHPFNGDGENAFATAL